MAGRRKYDEGCAVAHALDLVGERWGLLVVRELLLGPKRFTDLRAGLPGASADVVTQRLRELEEACVVTRRRLSPPASSWVYELTSWGAELAPVIIGLGRWGVRSPRLRTDAPTSIDSFILALPTLFDPTAAEGFAGEVAIELPEGRFVVSVADGHLHARRDDAATVDATLRTDRHALAAMLFGATPLAGALRGGTAEVEGDDALLKQFLTFFAMPPPVAPC